MELKFLQPLMILLARFGVHVSATVLLIIIVACVLLIVSLMFIASYKPKRISHGSAQWAERKDIKEFLATKGVALGKFGNKCFRTQSHIVACAPTGSGKGIGCIIPVLLEHAGSLICLDIKGENFCVTARQRKALGSRLCLVDPFQATGYKTHRYNWLDFINVNSPDCVGISAVLADMLAVDSESNYFDDSAKILLQGLILFVAAKGTDETRHIGQVRILLTLPLPNFTELLKDMSQTEAAFGVIKRVANQLLSSQEQGAGKEISAIVNSAKRFTAFLDDPRIVHALSGSDFALADIKKKSMSVFVVLPPDRLHTNRAFVRAFFALALSSVTATQSQPKDKVLFIYDEFAQLGYMEQVENAISLVRGYGVQFLIFVQDLSLLKGVYDKWQTFLANSTRLFFGCTDVDTAKYISQSLGKYTLETNSTNMNLKSVTVSYTGRDLMTPDEIMKLPATAPIVFLQGKPPVRLRRLNYLKDKEFKGLYSKNPFYQ